MRRIGAKRLPRAAVFMAVMYVDPVGDRLGRRQEIMAAYVLGRLARRFVWRDAWARFLSALWRRWLGVRRDLRLARSSMAHDRRCLGWPWHWRIGEHRSQPAAVHVHWYIIVPVLLRGFVFAKFVSTSVAQWAAARLPPPSPTSHRRLPHYGEGMSNQSLKPPRDRPLSSKVRQPKARARTRFAR